MKRCILVKSNVVPICQNIQLNCLRIICPQDITVPNIPGLCEAVVEYPDPCVANCPGWVRVGCDPPSGSTFPVGTTPVTCIAEDEFGNTASCTFTVTVEDVELPQVTCPSSIAVVSETPIVVAYPSPSVSDNCAVSVVCDPPSGSTFPVGTTTVTCTATDASGNMASCTFDVRVISPV